MQNATQLSMSEFYTTTTSYMGSYVDRDGNKVERETTKTLLRITDDKFQGKIATTAYLTELRSESTLSEESQFFGD